MSPESPFTQPHSLVSSVSVDSEEHSSVAASSASDQQSCEYVAAGSFGEITNREQNLISNSTDMNEAYNATRVEPENEDDESDSESAAETTQMTKKVKWTTVEDSRLRAAVSLFITGLTETDAQPNTTGVASSTTTRQTVNWGDVASRVPNRTPKQCRERWCYNLDPSINRGPFTLIEDAILLKAHKTLGNQWATIAKLLPNRTENAVKTRHKSVMRAQKREWKEYEDQMIMKLYDQFGGGRWNEFVRHFNKRTANALKTRFAHLKALSLNSLNNKLDRNKRSEDGESMGKETVNEGNVRQVWLNPQIIETVELDYYVKQNNKTPNTSKETENNTNNKEITNLQTHTEKVTEHENTVVENNNKQSNTTEPQRNTVQTDNLNQNILRNFTFCNNQQNFQNLNTLSNLAAFQNYPNYTQTQPPSLSTVSNYRNVATLNAFQNYPIFPTFSNFPTVQNQNMNNNRTAFEENCNKAITGVSLFQEAVFNDNSLTAQEKLNFTERSHSLSIDFFEAKKRKLQNITPFNN